MDRPRHGYLPIGQKDRRRTDGRWHRRRRRKPRRRGDGPDASGWAAPSSAAAELPERGGRDRPHGAGGGGDQPVAGLRPDREQGHARDGLPAGVLRPDQGVDTEQRHHEGRARDPCDRELRRGVRGCRGLQPGGCDQDASDEYEGGAGLPAAVLGRHGLLPQDGPIGGADGALQRVHTDDLEAGPLHDRAVRDARAGQEAAEGFLRRRRG